MKIRIDHLLFSLLIGLFCLACQPAKKTDHPTETPTEPAITALFKTTYILGDTISIQLSQPLTNVTVTADSNSAAVIQQTDNTLLVSSAASTIGLHQLIVNGVTATKKSVADTLNVELWSDIIPATRQFSVLKTFPHQSGSFTQGLEFYKGNLYESTGLNGQSKLMQVDLKTGSILKSTALPNQFFGEGITIVDNKIYQLTWTSGQCFRYTMDFVPDKTLTYHTQGWGLTHHDQTLILSDGTNKLYFLTPDFQIKGQISVYDHKGPIMNLNELEYVDGYVYANIWQTNRIVQIDVTSGKVVGNLNMEAILPAGVDTKEHVLNGIAFQPQENAFYITGKNWPTLTKIQLKNKEKRLVALR